MSEIESAKLCEQGMRTLAYAAGELDQENAANAEVHITGCPVCRNHLALYARLVLPAETEAETAALDELEAGSAEWARDLLDPPANDRAGATVRSLPPRGTWMLLAAASIVALIGASVVAGIVWNRPGDLDRGTSLLRKATRDDRLSVFRVSDADYAPHEDRRAATPPAMHDSLEASVAALERAVREHPTPEARRMLGLALFASGDLDGAARQLRTALDSAPGDPAIRNDLAAVLAARGEYGPALELLGQAAATARPGDSTRLAALFNAALVAERQGDVSDARSRWRRYLTEDGSSKWADEARTRLAHLESVPSSLPVSEP